MTPPCWCALAMHLRCRWTNPEGGKGGKSLDPPSMEVLALRGLPLGEGGEGAARWAAH